MNKIESAERIVERRSCTGFGLWCDECPISGPEGICCGLINKKKDMVKRAKKYLKENMKQPELKSGYAVKTVEGKWYNIMDKCGQLIAFSWRCGNSWVYASSLKEIVEIREWGGLFNCEASEAQGNTTLVWKESEETINIEGKDVSLAEIKRGLKSLGL